MNNNTKKHNCKCEICLKDMYLPKWIKDRRKHITCSRACLDIKRILINITEIERVNGINSLYDVIKTEYVINMKSIREISTKIFGRNTCASTVNAYMTLFGIEKRRGSEAIKTQWIDNDERRVNQAKRAKEHLGEGTPSREKLKKIMQTEKYKIKSSKAKKGRKNPMYGVVGEKHPNWDPKRTHEKRVRERKTYLDRDWRLSVFERDSYKCLKCGYNKGGILVAHHLNSYHWDEDNRYNIENGVTLCEPCHLDFHNKYGYMNNTKEQFKEYMKIQQLTLL